MLSRVGSVDGSFINGVVVVAGREQKNLTKNEEKSKEELPGYWDAEYIKTCIEQTDNEKERMLLRFLWMTGCRVSEALGVRKQDIDFINHVIKIRWLKSRVYKSRMIPMHPLLHEVLRVFSAPYGLQDKLFPYTRQRAWGIVKKCVGGHPHKFRHSFAVNWLRNGGDVVQLSHMLGHARVQTTMIYLRIVPTDIGKELMKITF